MIGLLSPAAGSVGATLDDRSSMCRGLMRVDSDTDDETSNEVGGMIDEDDC